MNRFNGVYANLPTPFDDDGERFSPDRLRAIIDFVVERGVHGIACMLSSGEYPYLTVEERVDVMRSVVEYVGKRIPVIVGVSAFTTAETCKLARDAEACGADAVIVMPIQYWKLREGEIVDHFRRVANATTLPIGLYDNPNLGGAEISARLYKRLRDEARISFNKDGSNQLKRVSQVVEACGQDFSVLHGNHMEMLAAYLFGASGVCTAMASVFPSECLRIYEMSVTNGMWGEARSYFQDISPLFRFFAEHSLARCVKEASSLMGRQLGPMRRPLTGLDREEILELKLLLGQYGYL